MRSLRPSLVIPVASALVLAGGIAAVSATNGEDAPVDPSEISAYPTLSPEQVTVATDLILDSHEYRDIGAPPDAEVVWHQAVTDDSGEVVGALIEIDLGETYSFSSIWPFKSVVSGTGATTRPDLIARRPCVPTYLENAKVEEAVYDEYGRAIEGPDSRWGILDIRVDAHDVRLLTYEVDLVKKCIYGVTPPPAGRPEEVEYLDPLHYNPAEMFVNQVEADGSPLGILYELDESLEGEANG